MRALLGWRALVLAACSIVLLGQAWAEPAATRLLSGDFWKADAAIWGDGRPIETPSVAKPPQGFKLDWAISVPQTGWYELFLVGAGGDCRHDLFIDGKAQAYNTTTDRPDARGAAKAGNYWLTAGAHTLRIQRVGRNGFPVRLFERFEFRPAEKRPEACVTAAKTLVDVVRAGETLTIRMTGGGTGQPTRYHLLSTDLMAAGAKPVPVGTVDFSASAAPVSKLVKIACPTEGAFRLSASTETRPLTASEFPIGDYAVIDVKAVPAATGAPVLLQEIDCVAQTLNGKPLAPDTFLECNGPTRVRSSRAGSYRESHDSTPPEAEAPLVANDPHSYSGFSYKVSLPALQAPYLIELTFPDDDRRSVTVNLNWIDDKTGGFAKGTSYSAKSYETGGLHPLSQAMRTQRMVVWSASQTMILGVLTQQFGHRAAVAKIRISRFPGDVLPVTRADTAGGRAFIHWYEEAENWRFLVNVASAYPGGIVHDFVGLQRWARLARYFGMNGLSACGAGYQSAFWRTTTLEGVQPTTYDQCRLAALICEKYGMKYVPEVFINQWYQNLVTFPGKAENPQDVRSVSCHGAESGTGFAPCNLNPLHPVVQQAFIDGIGELADKLRDSPAFMGVTVRADAWQFRGEFTFPSLHWGYGDWTIRQFEHDRQVVVPGKAGDAQRFVTRFEYLTAPAMRESWVQWRCDRLLDYHKRLRDRIRGNRTDLFFGISGDFQCDPSYREPDSLLVRAREAGVDLQRRRQEDGLVMMPEGRYGFRGINAEELRWYDKFLDPAYVQAGMGSPRSFGAYMVYHELASAWPAEKLGVKIAPRTAPYYCSAVVASGRHSLEKFAVVLAEQDTALFRDGGNTDVYGDPEIWNPWFAEFRALPAVPFLALDTARDPVAVWYRELRNDKRYTSGFYFYAVNREQYPVEIDLLLDKAGTVTALGTGRAVTLTGKHLTLRLEPYALQAFRASDGATIAAATTTAPPEQIAAVRDRLAFAQELAQAVQGPQKAELAEAERTAFLQQLDAAWAAYTQGHYWRARTALAMSPMQRIYERLTAMPAGQIVTAFPGQMEPKPHEGHWNPKEPMLSTDELVKMLPPGKTPHLRLSNTLNPAWGGAQVLMAEDGILTLDVPVPADGRYVCKIGMVADSPGVITASLAGQALATPAVTREPGAPESVAFPSVYLNAGTARLTLRRDGGAFGLYGMQMVPLLQPLPSAVWSVAGPFPSFWGSQPGRSIKADGLQKGFDLQYGPEAGVDLQASYVTADKRTVRWEQKTGSAIGGLDNCGVDMPVRTQSPSADFNFAVTYITADSARVAQLHLGVDWWADAYLNGEKVPTNINPKLREECGGAGFTSWYPHVGILKLKKGVNVLVIKQQGGSGGSCFSAYLTADPGLRCTATP
ncbi:MAG TPA: hypothetical protein VGL77_17935 [Armatimonadota bacterium]|jgi:hypothetical protein